MPFARPADLAACREMIRTGSRSFFMASLFLPSRMREAAYALYAFCRLSDDEVDTAGGPADAVARLQGRLDRVYAGTPDAHAVDRALADTVADYGVPKVLFEALLEGLHWDAIGRRYETLDEVQDYAARVAGSVGAMMAVLMGARSADMAARACDLGAAMQLTNIARDVGEDARMGRLYLPRRWLREAGLSPDAWLANPVPRPEIAAATERLLQEADALYARADRGVAHLDPAFRPAIFAARRLYCAIGDQVRRNGLDNISQRAVTPMWRKLGLLGLSLKSATFISAQVSAVGPPLPQTAFLVRAVAEAPQSPVEARQKGPKGVEGDMAWLVDLFTGMEARSGLQRPSR